MCELVREWVFASKCAGLGKLAHISFKPVGMRVGSRLSEAIFPIYSVSPGFVLVAAVPRHLGVASAASMNNFQAT